MGGDGLGPTVLALAANADDGVAPPPDAIAAHEITTAIAIGPYDLSADLGVCFEMDHPKMQEAVEEIRAAGEKAGKTMWRIGDGETLASEGYHFLCIGTPEGIFRTALSVLNQATKTAVRART